MIKKFFYSNKNSSEKLEQSKHTPKRMTNYEIELDREEKKKITTFFKSSDIKLVVFDLHGTLTNRTSLHPYHIEYRNQYIEKQIGLSFPKHFSGGCDDAFLLFPSIDKYAFYKHRDHDPLFRFEKIHSPNPKLAEELRLTSKHFHTVLYSDSYLTQIERTLTAIGIDPIFDSIIGLENGQKKESSQFTTYPYLCERFNINMENVLIIGDRMDKDINPVLNAGGNGIRIESSSYILEAIDLINKTFANNM